MVLVDTNNDGDLSQLERDLTEAVQTNQAAAAAAAEPGDTGPAKKEGEGDDGLKLPAKLQGKSLEDIAEMYANLESAYGRMANDLGTQRKLTDRLLDLKRSEDLQHNTPPAEPVKIDSSDFFDDPVAALDRYFESKMATVQTAQADRLDSLESELTAERFVQKHGDVSALGQDQSFIEFCNGSPYRQQLSAKAAQGDYAAADEIISEYRSIQAMLGKQSAAAYTHEEPGKATDTHENLEAARKASLEGNGSGDGGESGGKTYRRADLIRLKLERPDLYQDPSFQDEITRAYREGRVK